MSWPWSPTQTAQGVWLGAVGLLLAYEAWALTRGYGWTLTAGMRAWIAAFEPLKGLLGALLAWLYVHFVIERRRQASTSVPEEGKPEEAEREP